MLALSRGQARSPLVTTMTHQHSSPSQSARCSCPYHAPQLLPIILLLLLLCVPTGGFYIPENIPRDIPSLFPLQYITPDVVAQFYLEQGRRAVISAIIPVDSNDALAVFISEGAGGFLGGFAQRFISRIDGNKNRVGSELASAGSSGAFFGVAGAVRSLAYASGLSQVCVFIFSNVKF